MPRPAGSSPSSWIMWPTSCSSEASTVAGVQPSALGLLGGLQRVLELADVAQAIAAGGAAGEDGKKLLAQGIGHDVFLIGGAVCG